MDYVIWVEKQHTLLIPVRKVDLSELDQIVFIVSPVQPVLHSEILSL